MEGRSDRTLESSGKTSINLVDIEPRFGNTGGSANAEDNSLILNREACDTAVESVKRLFRQASDSAKLDEAELDRGFGPLVSRICEEANVMSLLAALECKDDYTFEHCVQVGILVCYIARWMGMSDSEACEIGKSAPLHDIGKCLVPSDILKKPARLTSAEFKEIRKHPLFGKEIIEASALNPLHSLVALQHHERMNGLPARSNGRADSSGRENGRRRRYMQRNDHLTNLPETTRFMGCIEGNLQP
jgi:HD-GYP domain-containing protein (c-di-GMP phosphodiesterase class II)